ncbi:GAF domain-containing protein [Anaeromyxobacter sp. Fw109-5]|uniref:GAF domain-containing protein n=1 Tax=Anaeromyxobacter sp. (strain Fw109-5) TaxID=404589 RepID=UPI0000ED6E28|nr:GAF domain-containing protein [Anaeromyxobacter sp. Fw109-5]ABS28329.1 multi-sensor signal transduction histidine kinase [Anaeromyxobacter sp. Fw109-5]
MREAASLEAVGTLVVRDGRILYASPLVAALAESAPEALVGTDPFALIAPEDRPRTAERYARRLRGEPTPAEYEVALALPSGERRAVELRVDVDGPDVVVRLRDVSARADRRPRLEALAALGAAIQRERSEAAVFERVRDGLRGIGLTALLMRPDGDGVRIEWASPAPDVATAFEERAGPLVGRPGRWSPFSRTVWEEGAAYSDDWGADVAAFVGEVRAEEARATAVALGLSRAIAVRLDERAAIRHYLVIVGDWLDRGDLAAVRLFGAQVAAALDASRIIADLSRRNAELAALSRLGAIAGDAPDLPSFFARAADLVRAASGCDGLCVYVLDDRAGELVCRFHDGVDAPPPGQPRLSLASPIGDVVRDRAARVVEGGGEGPGARLAASAGFAASAWVPLVARSRVVGVMVAGYRDGAERARARLDVLAAGAAHFGGAIESHGLLADLRRRVGELTLLNDLALASAQLDPVLLLDAALRRVCDTLDAGGAAFLRDGDRLLLVSGVGLAPDAARAVSQLQVGEGAPGLAVTRLAPVDGRDAAARGAAWDAFRAVRGDGPLVAVPLLAKTHALGALVLGRPAGGRDLEPGDVGLLSAIGVQLGVAVENARLFSDVRRRLSDLEAVHALALRIFGNAPGDVRALLEDGCRETARALSARAAAVLLVEPDGRSLRGVAAFGTPMDASQLRVSLDEDALAAEAFRRRAPAWTPDTKTDPRTTFGAAPAMPPLALLAVPLSSRAATRGVLYVADDAGRTFGDPELALANALAGELAVGLENAELYAETRARVEELSLLNEMGRTVAASLDLEQVLREGVEAARRLVGATRGAVLLYDPVANALQLATGTGLTPEEVAASRGAMRSGGISLRVIRERRAIVVDDVAADPQINALFRQRLAPRSLLAAPILLRGEPLGVLLLDESRRLRHFTEAEVQRVAAVGNQLAVAIENARLYQAARNRLAELSAVIDVARVVSSSLELEEVLGAGAEQLMRTLESPACAILLGDGRGQALRRAASRGALIGAERLSLAEPSLARAALEARAPLTGPADAGAADGPPVLAVPLHVRDQPVGVALVAGADAERTFTPGELSRAMAIASQLAVAVDNARLYSETRRRAEELALLHDVGRSLATLDIEQVLGEGVKNLARIVECPAAFLALGTSEGADLDVRAVAGPIRPLLGKRLSAGATALVARVLERREPLALENVDEDARISAEARALTGARAAVVLPLLVRERAIGVAVVLDTRGERRFTSAEIQRAAAISNQLAVAADNARLYEDLRGSYAELGRAQRQLIQQERLAALGELSAVVAHEVRNPLGVIFNSLGSLRRLLRPAGDAKLLLDIVGEEADRLNRIVGDLLDFARPSDPQLRPERLERVVEEAIHTALAQNPQGVEVSRDVDPELPAVPIDARLVRQAVINVAVNAIQAMPRGGRLTVRVRREDGTAALDVEDTGPGIPDEVKHRIFEPFFTTKASGTGLGLAVVKRIVDGHGGELVVHSRPGAGTLFRIRLPLRDPASAEKEPRLG